MRKTVLASLFLVASLVSSAHAQLATMGAGGGGFGGGAAAYVGPGDIALSAGTFKAWGGFRAFSAAKAGSNSARLQRASGTGTCNGVGGQAICDIKSLATGAFDAASAATFCTGTTCTVPNIYDQSGGLACTGTACDFQASVSGTLAYSATACNGKPGAVLSSGGNFVAPGVTTQNQPYTVVVVASRTGNTSSFTPTLSSSSDASLYFNNSSGSLLLYAGGIGSPTVSATEPALHSLIGVMNGNSSSLALDGTSTAITGIGTGTINNTMTFGFSQFGTLTGNACEFGFVNNAISGADAAALSANQHGSNGYSF